MKSGKFLQIALALIGYVEARGMLPLGCPDSFELVFGGCLQAIKDGRLLACLGREKISRHGFGGTGRGLRRDPLALRPANVLSSVKLAIKPFTYSGIKKRRGERTGALGLIITLGANGRPLLCGVLEPEALALLEPPKPC